MHTGRKYAHHSSRRTVPVMLSVSGVNTGNNGMKRQETKNTPCINKNHLNTTSPPDSGCTVKEIKKVESAMNAYPKIS